MNKQLLDKLEELQLPKIKKILIKLGNIEKDNDFKCGHCNIWSGKNKASLSAHLKACKSNPKKKEEEKEKEGIMITNSELNSEQSIEKVSLTKDQMLASKKAKYQNKEGK